MIAVGVVGFMALDLRSHGVEWQMSISIWSTQAGFESIVSFQTNVSAFISLRGKLCGVPT